MSIDDQSYKLDFDNIPQHELPVARMIEEALVPYFLSRGADIPFQGGAGHDFFLNVSENGISSLDVQEIGVVKEEGVHQPSMFRVKFDLKPSNTLDLDFNTFPRKFSLEDKAKMIGSNEKFYRIVSNAIRSGAAEITLDIFCKVHVYKSHATRELEGFIQLDKIGIPTLCCIYPSRFMIPNPKHENMLITLLEYDLLPMSQDPDLLGHNISKFVELVTVIKKMHNNLFFHGDTQLKNFGVKFSKPEVSVLTLDPEANADFSSSQYNLVNLQAVPKFQLYVSRIMERGIDVNDLSTHVLRNQLIQEAAYEDIVKMLESITPFHKIHDQSGYTVLQVLYDHYFTDEDSIIDLNLLKVRVQDWIESNWKR